MILPKKAEAWVVVAEEVRTWKYNTLFNMYLLTIFFKKRLRRHGRWWRRRLLDSSRKCSNSQQILIITRTLPLHQENPIAQRLTYFVLSTIHLLHCIYLSLCNIHFHFLSIYLNTLIKSSYYLTTYLPFTFYFTIKVSHHLSFTVRHAAAVIKDRFKLLNRQN